MINATGLTDAPTGFMDFSPPDAGPDRGPEGGSEVLLPPLKKALEDTFGLRLEPQVMPVDFIVVDHVEKIPTGN